MEFKLPDIGEGVAEGEIVKWLVREGDRVEEHQAVVEVMTDKATVEIPSPAAGTIRSFRAAEGEVVPVGGVLFELETSSQGSQASPPQAKAPAHAPAPPSASAAPARASAPATTREPASAPSRSEARSGAPSQGASIEFRLPDIGEGVAEGEIVKWLVQEGDPVEEHQAVVEVMTDKATVEIPSPAAGRIASLRVKPGEVVPVGQVLFTLATAGATAEKAATPAAKAAPPAAEKKAAAPEKEIKAAPRPAKVAAEATNGAPPAGNGALKVLAVPSARRVARELGIDLSLIQGSGRNGVVRRADVEAYAKEGAPAARKAAPRAPSPAIQAAESETRVPFRGVRRKIAEAMVRSKFTAPHFTIVEELDVTDLVAVRNKAKELVADQGVKMTYMPFIMKAVASGLARYPGLNSKLDEASSEIVTYRSVHIGIATDTEQGLIVPVIRNVEAKGLLQLATELGELTERTRNGKVRQEELKGSTFTITNAGSIGGTLATPIINYPDVAILGVHRIVKRPGVVERAKGDEIEIRQYMNLSLSVDHRIVDGATAARFLVHLRNVLESPGLLAL